MVSGGWVRVSPLDGGGGQGGNRHPSPVFSRPPPAVKPGQERGCRRGWRPHAQASARLPRRGGPVTPSSGHPLHLYAIPRTHAPPSRCYAQTHALPPSLSHTARHPRTQPTSEHLRSPGSPLTTPGREHSSLGSIKRDPSVSPEGVPPPRPNGPRGGCWGGERGDTWERGGDRPPHGLHRPSGLPHTRHPAWGPLLQGLPAPFGDVCLGHPI